MNGNKLTLKQMFLLGLNEPSYSRVEFWQQQQKESGFSPVVFWQKLNELWQHYFQQNYNDILEKNSWGNSITDRKIPLLMETNGLMTGHLGKPELEELHFSLFHYGFNLKQNLFPYEYDMNNIQTSKESSPAKQLAIIHLLNQQKFINELKEKQAGEIGSFLDFHFRSYQRKVAKENDIELLVEEWRKLTKKIMPSSLAPTEKDVFLLWFEQHDLKDHEHEPAETENDIVSECLNCLSGYWRKTKIMKEDEFKRLIEYARHTMETGKLPNSIKPISKGFSGLPKLFYQHSIYRLFKVLKTSHGQSQALWIEFLVKVFKDHYKSTGHDLSKTFSRYTSGKSGYDADKETITF